MLVIAGRNSRKDKRCGRKVQWRGSLVGGGDGIRGVFVGDSCGAGSLCAYSRELEYKGARRVYFGNLWRESGQGKRCIVMILRALECFFYGKEHAFGNVLGTVPRRSFWGCGGDVYVLERRDAGRIRPDGNRRWCLPGVVGARCAYKK